MFSSKSESPFVDRRLRIFSTPGSYVRVEEEVACLDHHGDFLNLRGDDGKSFWVNLSTVQMIVIADDSSPASDFPELESKYGPVTVANHPRPDA